MRRLTIFMAVLFISCFLAAAVGLDTYEIYLNDKLIVRQAVNQPLAVKNLHLTDANANDNLLIKYNQCHSPQKPMTSRSISLRDAGGRIVREWTFGDGNSSSPMVIPVRELLDVQNKSDKGLVLYYSADGFGQAQKLAGL